MILRQASLEPKSFNEEKRTVDVVFSTGSQVRRFSFFDGEFMEELRTGQRYVHGLWLLNDGLNTQSRDPVT